MLNESNIPLEEDGIEEEILVDEEVAITKAMWGDVGGNIENQTDLQNALDAKQDSLTEAQLSAVNSGITSEKVTTYDGYADQIASKADQSALNAETIARGEADTALGTRIDNEALARQQTDNGLQSQIDAITSKSDVVDVVANYAALQAYDTSTLGNNDVVKVLDDETHDDALTYYRWSTTTQTWSYIGQEAPYYSKGQMDVKLAEKQDKLTAGANIQIQNGTISATDTTYTAGNGLNLNGTEFSANTDVLATKEDLEGYYTKPETDNLLAPKLEAEVVAELPSTGAEGKLYLTPKAHTTSTATGNPIEATITAQAGQLESFQLDGDTFQQSYNGSNLIDMPIVNGSRDGVTWVVNSDGSITLNGTATAYVSIRANNTSIPAVAGETYTLSATGLQNIINFGYKNSDSGTDIFVVTSGSPVKTEQVTAGMLASANRLDMFIKSGSSFNNQRVTLQLEKGSTASSYEPFVGGQPSPSPDYPQQIQTVTGEQTVEVQGKNLLNSLTFVKGRLDNGVVGYQDGTSVLEATATDITFTTIANFRGITSDYIQVVGGSSYIQNQQLSFDNNVGAAIAQYDSSKTFIQQDNISTGTVITMQATTAYIRIYYFARNAGTITLHEPQLEAGSTATQFVPYSKQTLPLDLGTIELCKLATYQDYIWKDGNDWKIHKATGKHLFNGGEAFTSDGSVQGIYQFRWTDSSVLNNSNQTIALVASDKFRGVIWNSSWTKDFSVVQVVLQTALRFMTSLSSSVEGFKTWLASNNAVVHYALATPTDTTITDTTLIAQLEAIRTASLENGTNTITNTATGTNLAGDMEIGYFGFNPTNRYDKWLWLDLNNNYEQIGGE